MAQLSADRDLNLVLTASSKLWRPVRRLRVQRTLSSATAATLDRTPAARSRTLALAPLALALTAPFAELYARLNQPDIFIVDPLRAAATSFSRGEERDVRRKDGGAPKRSVGTGNQRARSNGEDWVVTEAERSSTDFLGIFSRRSQGKGSIENSDSIQIGA